MQGTKGLSLERLERVNKYGVCLTGKYLGGQTPPTKENRMQNCGNVLHRENMLERYLPQNNLGDTNNTH